jgi:uncharacterized protein Veg
MKKCDYCGKKIGLFSVMYTWLEKKENLAIHDRCLKEWYKKNPDIEKLFENTSDPEKLSDFLKDILMKILYLYFNKPERYTKKNMIKWYEEHIKEIKNNENYPNKEKTLELYNELLKQLKNENGEQKEIDRLQKEINQYTQQNYEIQLAEAQNRLKEISWQYADWKYIIVSGFLGIIVGLILYLLKNP